MTNLSNILYYFFIMAVKKSQVFSENNNPMLFIVQPLPA